MWEEGIIPIEVGKVYHYFLGATKVAYQGRGVNKLVTDFGEKLAKERGFEYLLTETTSPITQHIYRKKGYKCVKELPYKDLVFPVTGRKMDLTKFPPNFFKEFEPAARIMIKKIHE